jgi:hypothetical protein
LTRLWSAIINTLILDKAFFTNIIVHIAKSIRN